MFNVRVQHSSIYYLFIHLIIVCLILSVWIIYLFYVEFLSVEIFEIKFSVKRRPS